MSEGAPALGGGGPPGEPLAPRSVALGLHLLSDISATDGLRVMLEQARHAEAAGFDGVTVSEHHAGMAGYMPQPLLMSSWILDATDHVWSGPMPTLLTLRTPALVAEELAWTAARYPGRLAAGFAAGYAESDFRAVGSTDVDLVARFAHGLVQLADALSPAGSLSNDTAVQQWGRTPPPLVSATHSPASARRAAAAGMGALLIGSDDVTGRPRTILDAYEAAGGSGPVVWIRRVCIGRPSAAAVRELEATYGAWDGGTKGSVSDVIMGSAGEVAGRLGEELAHLGPNAALNVRVHLPGLTRTELVDQIRQFGDEVLPALRSGR